jgi:transposase-like protein
MGKHVSPEEAGDVDQSPESQLSEEELKAYIDGIEKAYGADTKHRQSSSFEVRNDNNLIERFHGTLKDRTKVMRAQKNKATLQRFTDGWLVYYNFFRPNMASKNRPTAEVAGLNYECHNQADVLWYKKKRPSRQRL